MDRLPRLKAFLLADQFSLKVVFDNIRNTIIAATVISGGVWVRSYQKPPFDQVPLDSELRVLLGRVLLFVGFILVTLNLAQLYVMHIRAREFLKIPAKPSTDETVSEQGLIPILFADFVRAIVLSGVMVILLALQLATIGLALLFTLRIAGEVL